jgi:hypothetical protein
VGRSIQTKDKRVVYVYALKAAGLLDLTATALSASGCIDLGEHDIGSHIDEQLGLEEGTYEEKLAAEQGAETTNPKHRQTKHLVFYFASRAIRKAECAVFVRLNSRTMTTIGFRWEA